MDDLLSRKDYESDIGGWDDSPEKILRLLKHDEALRARVRELEDDVRVSDNELRRMEGEYQHEANKYNALRDAVSSICVCVLKTTSTLAE